MSWSTFAIENAEIKAVCIKKTSLKSPKENQYNKIKHSFIPG